MLFADYNALLSGLDLRGATHPDLRDLTVRGVRLHLGGCEWPRIEVDATGPMDGFGQGSGGMGSRVRLGTLMGPMANGGVLTAACLPPSIKWGGVEQTRTYRLARASMAFPAATQTRQVAVLVHGFPGLRAHGSSGVVGDWNVHVRQAHDVCTTAGSAWLVFDRAGKAMSLVALLRDLPDLLDCISIVWGMRVIWKVVFAVDASAKLVRCELRPPSPHWKGAIHGWTSSEDEPFPGKDSLIFLGEAFRNWKSANGAFGIATAADHVVRSTSTNVLDWEARDLVIAVERMAKIHTGGARGNIKPLLLRLESQIGLADSVSEAEREAFRLFRNRLSHVGDLRDVGPRLRSGRALYRSVGWLRTFALRHIYAALGWRGSCVDFCVVPHRPRNVLSRRFTAPPYIPPET